MKKAYIFLFGPLLLLVVKASTLTARAVDPDVDSRVPIDEEQLIENLIKQGQLSSHNGARNGELELELEPFDQPEQDQTAADVEQEIDNEKEAVDEKRTGKAEKKGEAEFVTFIAPDPHPASRKLEKPQVEVKRAMQAAPDSLNEMGNTIFIAVTTVCTAAAMFGLVVAGVFWYKLHKQHVAAAESEYPQYGVIGPAKEKKTKKQQATTRGDESMAYSAQLHHYQQTKQKIISMEHSGGESREQESEESEAEGEEGDYSVYECPGLAPTGDIEVSNPMFENASKRSDSGSSEPKECD